MADRQSDDVQIDVARVLAILREEHPKELELAIRRAQIEALRAQLAGQSEEES